MVHVYITYRWCDLRIKEFHLDPKEPPPPKFNLATGLNLQLVQQQGLLNITIYKRNRFLAFVKFSKATSQSRFKRDKPLLSFAVAQLSVEIP